MKERGNPYLRFLDRFVLIPLVYLLGLFKKRRPFPQGIKKVALLKTAGVGDTVLLSAVIRDIQKQRPDIVLTLFTGTTNREMGEMIDVRVKALPMTRPHLALKIVREESYDLFIDCDPWPRINALLTFFSRSLFTMGFKTAGQGRHFVYDLFCAHSAAHHELHNYRALMAPLGVQGSERPHIFVKGDILKKSVVFHLFPGGSRWYLKVWPEEKWRELILQVIQEGYEVVLTGSRQDRVRLEAFVEGLPKEKIRNCAGELTLRETAALLYGARSVVSVDTGIMHLAAAVGAPTIGLHGPTSPHRWGAIGERVVAITPKLPYSPCISLGFESKCQRNLCMQAIEVIEVKEALFHLLENKNEDTDPSRRERESSLAAVAQKLSQAVPETGRRRDVTCKECEKSP